MLLLYAITDSPRPPAHDGLGGSPLRAIAEDGLVAIASDHDNLGTELSEADLWAYDEVVEALMDEGSVLPMRLGSSLPDDATVQEMLRRRAPELRRALGRVRGAVELGVRAVVPIPEERDAAPVGAGASRDQPDAPGPGTAYMLGRLEAERRTADAATRIHGPLASLARESTRRAGSERAGAFNVAYLVDRDRLEAFRDRVEELSEELPDVTIVCTGPWPPYSFSSMEPSR